MKQAALSFLLALAIEAVSAVFNYLRDKLVNHLNRNQPNYGFDPEYA
jgi:hypothetical protein